MAAKLQCEICGGKLIGKPGGIFECENCGTEYSTEWAKAKIQEITGTVKVEGTVEVTGKVQVENGGPTAESLVKRGMQVLAENKYWFQSNHEKIKDYFMRALEIDPECGAAYWGLYLESKECQSVDVALEKAGDWCYLDRSGNLEKAKKYAMGESLQHIERLEQQFASADQSDTLPESLRAVFAVRNGTLYSREQRSLHMENYIGGELDEIVIPGGITKIGNGALQYMDLVYSVCIPETVKEIGASAFAWCENLHKISIPASIRTIGNFAFEHCSNLSEIVIPDSVDEIGAGAFEGCRLLRRIQLPKGLKKLEIRTFDDCPSLKKLDLPNDLEWLPYKQTYTFRFIVDSNTKAERVCKDRGYQFEFKKEAQDAKAENSNQSRAKTQEQNTVGRETLRRLRERSVFASNYIAAGMSYTAGLRANGSVLIAQGFGLMADVKAWDKIESISGGKTHVVGLRSDSSVLATNTTGMKYDDGRCNVIEWKDIKAIHADQQTVGLKRNGTVVAAGGLYKEALEVSEWTDIVKVVAADKHTVGLDAEGNVVVAGRNEVLKESVHNWRDIVDIASSSCHVLGLKKDGTVIAAGDNKTGACNVSDWSDVVAVYTGSNSSFGLRSDGTVLTAGVINRRSPDCSKWRNIISLAVSGGEGHVLGLSADGTVIAAGCNNKGQCEVQEWSNIVAIAAGNDHSVGVTKDGYVKAVGAESDSKYSGPCRVKDWRLFEDIDELVASDKAEKTRAASEHKAKLDSLTAEKARLQSELPLIRGLFAGSKKAKIEARLAEIEAELKKLG